MAKNILAAILLVFVLQACQANKEPGLKNSEAGWEDCSKVAGIPCAGKNLGGKKAADVFDAFGKAGVEGEKDIERYMFSVLGASCSKTVTAYKCTFRYHKFDKGGELSPEISIMDVAGQNDGKAKSLYTSLVNTGLTEECNSGVCVVAVTSVGCRKLSSGGSVDCSLSKGSAN